MMTVDQFVADYIKRWEGGMSDHPNDAGNWSTGKKGSGVLLGSNLGVTGRTLAAFRGVPITTIRRSDIEKLTLTEAVAVARKLFYSDNGIAKLSWNRVTASVMDFGWGAGPVTTVKMLQDLLDVTIDGQIGPATAGAYSNLLKKGEEFVSGAWWAMREEYYEELVVRRPTDAMYLKGWDNRSGYFTPGHSEGWWNKFGG